MPRRRLNRDESRARTRERLLDAAGRLFVAHGVEGASVDDIAEAAGYTKGAFYANFKTKADAFLAVMERHAGGATAERNDALAPTADQKALRAAARRYMHKHAHQWDRLALGLEIKLAAAREARIRSKFVALRREVVAGAAGEVRAVTAGLGRRPLLDPELVCLATEALVEGLAILHRIDRQSASEANVDAILDVFLDRVILGEQGAGE